jgi:hypothetical protein
MRKYVLLALAMMVVAMVGITACSPVDQSDYDATHPFARNGPNPIDNSP